jgi:hypothetical protein
MKKYQKMKVRKLINLEEPDGKQKSINKLKKRYDYLKSKQKNFSEPSRQMKYIVYHIKKLGANI